jgi:hypothetical protein
MVLPGVTGSDWDGVYCVLLGLGEMGEVNDRQAVND